MTTETNPLDNRQGVKHTGASKTARIPIKVVPLEEKLKKPEWIRAKLPNPKKFFEIKKCIPSARKPPAPTSANASAKARPPS